MITYGITNRTPPTCATAKKGSWFNPHTVPRSGLVHLGTFATLKEATDALILYTTPTQGNC